MPQEKAYLSVVRSVSSLVGLTSFMVIAVLIQTFSTTIPAHQLSATAIVKKGHSGYLLYESRVFDGHNAEPILLQRFLYKKEDAKDYLNFPVESGLVASIREGSFTVNTVLPLPLDSIGEWCSGVTLLWWPPWSQMEHTLKIDEVCFDISKPDVVFTLAKKQPEQL